MVCNFSDQYNLYYLFSITVKRTKPVVNIKVKKGSIAEHLKEKCVKELEAHNGNVQEAKKSMLQKIKAHLGNNKKAYIIAAAITTAMAAAVVIYKKKKQREQSK